MIGPPKKLRTLPNIAYLEATINKPFHLFSFAVELSLFNKKRLQTLSIWSNFHIKQISNMFLPYEVVYLHQSLTKGNWNGFNYSAILAVAMIVNMAVASLAGLFIPKILAKVGVDPALAGSVILTTVTDVIGFFVFLGGATVLFLS